MRSFGQLKWRCRRGVVELDILLRRYLETHYLLADQDERDRFAGLLEWEDDELQAVLVGGEAPAISGFNALIDKIRRVAGIS
jgi:antitoxin CptB